MAGKQVTGTGLSESIAGMSKNQLYDIMSQMKALIEQNQLQAKQILIQNPLLTKALFQAQIMLGMVRPPQPSVSQHPQLATQSTQQSNFQPTHTAPGLIGVQDQTGAPQLAPPRKQYQNQPSMPTSSDALPSVNIRPQSVPLVPLQTPQKPKGYEMPQGNPVSLPQLSQMSSGPPIPPSSVQPPLHHQPQVSNASIHLQQPLQTAEIPHMPLPAPLPPHSRSSPIPNFHQHYPQQMAHNMSYQPAGMPQHVSQPMFHSGNKLPPGIGNSFPQGQPALPSHGQPPSQSMFQGGGSNLGPEFINHLGTSKPADRGPWMSGPPENSALAQLSGPLPPVPSQMGPSSQPPRPGSSAQSLSPEMEKMLLQQVMSLTQEQINLLPPEQRNQVLQLQQILRQ